MVYVLHIEMDGFFMQRCHKGSKSYSKHIKHTSPSLCSRGLSADFCAMQDTGEAMDAAEDAADAVEHVADMAEDDDRPASQSSVGDVPIPKRGNHQLFTHTLP